MKLLPGLKRKTDASVYSILPYAVFAFVALCFALHPASPFFTHHLADPDDYMRLDQVTAWLQGQGWNDLSVPRLSPGAHTTIHWSRLIDLPIAALALPFIANLGIANAVLTAALIMPLLWLAVLLTLLPALAKPLAECRASLSCVLVLFVPLLLFQYMPGRVDHHGAQAIIAGFALLCLTNIIRDHHPARSAILAAAALACGFWIGAESLPWAILFIACLAIVAAFQGAATARSAALFGLCLPLFTATLIPAALPVAEFSSRALSWFSPVYVIFAALSGGIFILGWPLTRRIDKRSLRLALYALLGIIATVAFFALIPAALRGPFADYDTFDATAALDNITEARPLIHAFHLNRFMPATFVAPALTFFRLIFLPLTALIASLIFACRARHTQRLIWLTHTTFLTAAFALTLFWQLRVGIFMELFTLAPLTALLGSWWDRLRWSLWDRPLFWAETRAFLLLGPLPVLLLPALITPTPLYPDLLLFPAARAAPVCPLEPVTAFLNTLKPQTIMNSSDTGPQLLFATPHSVVAGNFDVPGNADAFAFFSATTDAPAQEAAHKWNATLVLLCRTAPTLYLGKDYYAPDHTRLLPGKDGMLRFTNTDPAQPLIERLIRGQIPGWLKPIEIPGQSDYLLFEIRLPPGKK